MPRAVFRPRSPFVTVGPDGVKHRFDPSTLVAEGHWVLKGRESLFEPVDDYVDRVEQATAAPGEIRNVSRTAKKAASKSD